VTHANAPNASARSAWRRSIADEDDDDSAGTPLSFSARVVVVVVRCVFRRVAGIARAIVVVVVVVAHGMVAVRRQPRAREWRAYGATLSTFGTRGDARGARTRLIYIERVATPTPHDASWVMTCATMGVCTHDGFSCRRGSCARRRVRSRWRRSRGALRGARPWRTRPVGIFSTLVIHHRSHHRLPKP